MTNGSVVRWQIRAARETDLESLTDLLARSFHSQEGLGKWFYPLLRAALREDLRIRLRGKAFYCCLVATGTLPDGGLSPEGTPEPEEVLLGTVEMGLKSQFFLPWYCWFKSLPYLSNLAIAPSHRRRGIAAQLLQACEPIAKTWGHHDLYLHVLENNRAARALYLKAGFRVCQAESSLASVFLGQPRQLLLHKGIPAQQGTGMDAAPSLSQP